MKYVPFLIYNLILLAGSAYLVVVHEWSLWTFFFAMLFMYSVKFESK